MSREAWGDPPEAQQPPECCPNCGSSFHMHGCPLCDMDKRRIAVTAERDALRAELTRCQRSLAETRSDFAVLQRALVGDTGASAITVAGALRAELATMTQRATCGCGDQFTAHDPGTCGACVAGLNCAPAPTAQPIPPTVTLGMVETLERTADLIDETRKRLDAVGTRLEQYQTEIAPTAQPVQAQGDNP